MKPTPNQIICGDSSKTTKSWPANCIDSILTDPPYGLSFMGKEWDHGVPGILFWREFLRITKPGGILLCFGGTRTFHRLTCAIEDAGWEIRDCMMWLYGSGFPKSHNISKAIQKAKGIKPDKVEPASGVGFMKPDSEDWNVTKHKLTMPEPQGLAQLWDGYGTALKPAWEPIIVAMKPIDGTFAANAEKHGVAGLNIDGGRIGAEQRQNPQKDTTAWHGNNWSAKPQKNSGETKQVQGRWPANLILDEEAGKMLDEQSITSTTGNRKNKNRIQQNPINTPFTRGQNAPEYTDSGGASRFFKRIEITVEDLIWNNTFVIFVEKLLWIIEAIIENSVHGNVKDWQEKKNVLIAKCVEKKLELCEIYTVLTLAGIKNLGFNQEVLQVIQDFIGNYNECTLILNLVLSVANEENTDIIQTTTTLLKSYGFVPVAIKQCTQKTNQLELSRFKYVPKTSRKERNMGMENCEDKLLARSGGARSAEKQGDTEYLQGHMGLNRISKVKNNHPTVKPLALMKYLCTLIKMPSLNQIVLDPFMGSGTTGMACADLGINFIGIDKEFEYCEIAQKRITAIRGKTLPISKNAETFRTTKDFAGGTCRRPKDNPSSISEHRQSIINAAAAKLRSPK